MDNDLPTRNRNNVNVRKMTLSDDEQIKKKEDNAGIRSSDAFATVPGRTFVCY